MSHGRGVILKLGVLLLGLSLLAVHYKAGSVQAAREPLPLSAPAAQLQANGERVYIAGIQNGAAKFAWTDNVLVPSPDWSTNNTGLPTSGVTSVNHLRIDPTDPAKDRGYVVVNDVLYRNDAMRNGGAWTVKLNPGGEIIDVG